MRSRLPVVLVLMLAVAGCEPDGASPLLAARDAEVRELALGARLTPLERLGKRLFFDRNLSKHRNQSCATCHDPAVGFAGGATPADSVLNAAGAVHAGSDPTLFGNRKPPSAAYAGDAGPLSRDAAAATWFGGMFWDGRATGWELGDPLAEQAKGPFLNPVEMALSSAEELRDRVRRARYAGLFRAVFGPRSLRDDAALVHDRVGIAIAAYERSREVNPYSSRFDAFWDRAGAEGLDVTAIREATWTDYRGLGLNDDELRGLAIFADPMGADCASCHTLAPGSAGYPLFTDFSYHNLGIPRNPDNPFYQDAERNLAGPDWADEGLGAFLAVWQPDEAAAARGKVKTPTLRNVDERPYPGFVRAYGHNGVFESLEEIVRFYHCAAGMRGGPGSPMAGGGMGGMGNGGMGNGGMGNGGMGSGGMGSGGMGSGGMGSGGMGNGGMGNGGMGGDGGMGLCATFGPPEVAENLTPLRFFPMAQVPLIEAFLKTLTDRPRRPGARF